MSHINGPSQASSSSTRLIPQFSTKELRPRVVEILSHTANGCLSELGYFPGMAQRLQELEGIANKWQQENIKLFADNRTLSIAYSNATTILRLQGKDAWLLECQRLQNELQAARNEMAALIKDRTAMQERITALSSGEEMQELLKNHENMRRMFAQLWEENKELKKRPMPVAHQIPVPTAPAIL
ncbi:hypothetical protein ONZ45_g18400 [Pleurotus djamor]|nr:hypothetical protein ONZ45_g18400 [Pleurotus djamor]